MEKRLTTIKKNHQVKIHCEVLIDDNEYYAKFAEDNPLIVTAGVSKESPIREAMSKKVVGMDTGESDTINLSCDNAFGMYDPAQTGTIPLSEFDTPLQIGDVIGIKFEGEDAKNETAATVIDMSETDLTYDLNHPLAGHDIILKFKVIKT